MSLVGSAVHSLDSKKRVFVPAKYRDELGDVFYITRKIDGYLSIYTSEEWDKFVEKISSIPESDGADLQDYFLGVAQKCIPDANGRIIINDDLLRHAGITKNIVFIGIGKQIRVWSEEAWNEREAARDNTSLKEKMKKYDF